MKWTETITPKQAVEELGVPYHGWMREMDRAWVSEDGQYSGYVPPAARAFWKG